MALTAYVGVYMQMMYEKMIMSGHDSFSTPPMGELMRKE